MSRAGADLALLLLAAYRRLVDTAVVELAHRGFPDASAAHEFAMRAVDGGADHAAALARALGVSKQAAAKTIALLTDRGYVTQEVDERDARRRTVRVTDRGHALMRTGEQIFDELRARWVRSLGEDDLIRMESLLARAVGDDTIDLDAPGSVSGIDA